MPHLRKRELQKHQERMERERERSLNPPETHSAEELLKQYHRRTKKNTRKRKENDADPIAHLRNLDPRKFYSFIEETVMQNSSRDVYIDTNHLLFSPPWYCGTIHLSLFESYAEVVRVFTNNISSDKFRYLNDKMREANEGIRQLLEHPEVMVTKSVLTEMAAYRNKLMNVVRRSEGNRPHDAQILQPAVNITNQLLTNYRRRKNQEENPVVEILFGGIPDKITAGGHTFVVSKKEKYLVASALADGISDGREKRIFTWDEGLARAVQQYHTYVNTLNENYILEHTEGKIPSVKFDVVHVGTKKRDGFCLRATGSYTDFFHRIRMK